MDAAKVGTGISIYDLCKFVDTNANIKVLIPLSLIGNNSMCFLTRAVQT